MPRPVLAALAALAALATGAWADDEDFCASVTTCLRDGSESCATATDDCPPCIYTLADSYSCWEKDNSTNTCPFTGVRYDCTGAWGSSASTSASAGTDSGSAAASASSASGSSGTSAASSSAATAASGSGSGAISTSSLITFIAIGVAALLVLVIGCVVWRRKRRSAQARRDLHTPPRQKRERGMSKRDDALTGPYNNLPETNKSGGGAYGGYAASTSTTATAATNSSRTGQYGGYAGSRRDGKARKQSEGIAMMEPARDSHESFVSIVPTEDAGSFDGILGERSPSVLGDDARSYRSGRSGGRAGRASRPGVVVGGIGGFAAASEKLAVQQEVASRVTTTNNMYDEYLRMKQELELQDGGGGGRSTGGPRAGGMSDAGLSDLESDLESDTMSMHKFSLDSSTGMLARHHDNGLSLTDSVTDSEYAAAMRGRGESDCFSEMSYNDEKYSFSESDVDGASLDGSHMRGARAARDREIEI